jgi:hypothetical protein
MQIIRSLGDADAVDPELRQLISDSLCPCCRLPGDSGLCPLGRAGRHHSLHRCQLGFSILEWPPRIHCGARRVFRAGLCTRPRWLRAGRVRAQDRRTQS